MQHPMLSRKAERFTESVIRGMSIEARKYGAVNLSQGMPDFPAPEEIKEAACRAIRDDINQYAITWGSKNLREAIAEHLAWHQGMEVDPEQEITVTCGSTEAMIVTLLSLINPGDEVILTQPYYENYWPDCVIAGAEPRFVPIRPPGWAFDPDELAAAFNDRTKAIVLCNPNNPTGTVLSREELEQVAALCRKWDVVAITDEIYEHILYDGRRHTSLATLDGMRERSVTISGMSKTFAVTGWRVGTIIAPRSYPGHSVRCMTSYPLAPQPPYKRPALRRTACRGRTSRDCRRRIRPGGIASAPPCGRSASPSTRRKARTM